MDPTGPDTRPNYNWDQTVNLIMADVFAKDGASHASLVFDVEVVCFFPFYHFKYLYIYIYRNILKILENEML